jgi:ABC-type nitrate/sulfonate/bicarbonate transport system ATPase subunit
MNTYPSKGLHLDGISYAYEGMPVLEDIRLTLAPGEFAAIIGPSGCGKTTLFNIIAGLLPPDRGRVLIDGEDHTSITGRVSYMHQKDLLLPWKKVIDNVALPHVLKGLKKKEARERVRPYFEIFGLEGFEMKYPYQLSGGMRQRVALMRTYMFSEDLILLDEPFGGLDAITKERLQDWWLEVIGRLDAACLLITHDVDEAIHMANRIYVLTNRPAAIGDVVEVTIDREDPEAFMALRKRIVEELTAERKESK